MFSFTVSTVIVWFNGPVCFSTMDKALITCFMQCTGELFGVLVMTGVVKLAKIMINNSGNGNIQWVFSRLNVLRSIINEMS